MAEAKARDLLDRGQDAITCESVYRLIKQSQLPPQTKHRPVIKSDDATVTAWTFGFWSHGGQTGITTITKQRPVLTKVLTCLARQLALGVELGVGLSVFPCVLVVLGTWHMCRCVLSSSSRVQSLPATKTLYARSDEPCVPACNIFAV